MADFVLQHQYEPAPAYPMGTAIPPQPPATGKGHHSFKCQVDVHIHIFGEWRG